MTAAEIRKVAARYELTSATVKNWLKLETSDWPIPWDEPDRMVAWYRAVKGGRLPKEAFVERCQALAAGEGNLAVEDRRAESDREDEASEVLEAADAVETVLGDAGVDEIKRVLAAVGLSESLGRILTEERLSYQRMMAARRDEDRATESAERVQWLKIVENKRAIHKTADAVETAVGLFREWSRREQEARLAQLRGLLEKEFREEFKAAAVDRGEPWELAWQTSLELVLARWIESISTKENKNENGQ